MCTFAIKIINTSHKMIHTNNHSRLEKLLFFFASPVLNELPIILVFFILIRTSIFSFFSEDFHYSADMIVSYSAHSGFTSSISLVPEEITLDTKCKKDAQNVAMKVKSVEAGSPFNIVIG